MSLQFQIKIRQFQIDWLCKLNRFLKYRNERLKFRINKLLDAQMTDRARLGVTELPPGGVVLWDE